MSLSVTSSLFVKCSFTYEVAPVFVLMEREALRGLRLLVGWTEGDGIFCPGGSASNMYAMNLARYQRFPEVKSQGLWGLPRLSILTSPEVIVENYWNLIWGVLSWPVWKKHLSYFSESLFSEKRGCIPGHWDRQCHLGESGWWVIFPGFSRTPDVYMCVNARSLSALSCSPEGVWFQRTWRKK